MRVRVACTAPALESCIQNIDANVVRQVRTCCVLGRVGTAHFNLISGVIERIKQQKQVTPPCKPTSDISQYSTDISQYSADIS